MKSKHIQFAAALPVAFLALGGCAVAPIEHKLTPETMDHTTEVDHTTEAVEAVDELAIHATTHSELIHHVNEPAASERLEPGQVTVSRPASPHEAPPVIHRNTNRTDVELTISDSISYLVIIRPADFLGKIAMREYDNAGKWSSIYRWNRALIGDDPNLIHPYHELELFKPEHEISDWTYNYIIHAVAEGETLWSIAKDWYGDNLAWITIYADNEELFSSNSGRLTPGMELKIRTSLFGPPSDEQRVSRAVGPEL